MAVVSAVNTKPQRGVVKVSWSSLASGDTASPASLALYPDKTAQFTGTFTTGSVTLQGSNDGTNYIALVDPQGNSITASTGGRIEALLENPQHIKPVVTVSSTGMAVDVVIIGRSS